MKGLQHSVIEIKDTENKNIEKILVFLSPHQQKIDVAATRKEAQEILQKVKIRDRMPRIRINLQAVALLLGMLSIVPTLLIVLF